MGSVGFLKRSGLPCQPARQETCSAERRLLLTFMLFYQGKGGCLMRESRAGKDDVPKFFSSFEYRCHNS